MRIVMPTLLILSLVSVNCPAREPVGEAHAMIYYQLPLGAHKQQRQYSFGLRLDRTGTRDGIAVDYRELLQRPALFDFRMGQAGIQSIRISGTEYRDVLLVHRADGDEDAAGTTESGSGMGERVTQRLKNIPIGVYAGVLLGVGLVIGAGD